jgi:hypothetical protein
VSRSARVPSRLKRSASVDIIAEERVDVAEILGRISKGLVHASSVLQDLLADLLL